MDPNRNPYAPGAGNPPPELAGRDEIIETARIALERARAGRSSRSILLVGLRGVGKTVLINRIRENAEASGIHALRAEAREDRSLPSILAPELRSALLKLSNREAARHLAQRGLRALAGFVGALRVKYQDIEVGLDVEPEPGLADNGDLETDLLSLLKVVGEAARAEKTCVALFVDELQYVKADELAALATALHRANQDRLPIILVGAGLLQLRANMGEAKSYTERLFEFHEIGALSENDARRAIQKPAADEGVEFSLGAVPSIIKRTRCHPYFLQEWGKHVWNTAERSPITGSDVAKASEQVIPYLDQNLFRVRFDGRTTLEKKYMRAMAQFGAGPHSSGEITREMNRSSGSTNNVRTSLISKGLIFSPRHGEVAFTVPLFDEFMLRVMPGDDWRSL